MSDAHEVPPGHDAQNCRVCWGLEPESDHSLDALREAAGVEGDGVVCLVTVDGKTTVRGLPTVEALARIQWEAEGHTTGSGTPHRWDDLPGSVQFHRVQWAAKVLNRLVVEP